MKKIIGLLLVGAMVLGMVGCGEKPNREDEVKILPKPQEQVMAVESIEELHKGRAWDISSDGKTLLFSWDEDVPESDSPGEMAPSHHLYTMNLADKTVVKLSNAEMGKHQGFARYSPDGKTIAFTENTEEMFTPYVMANEVMGEKKQLQSASFPLATAYLCWSSEGELAVPYYDGQSGEIFLYNPQNNKFSNITAKGDRNLKTRPLFYNKDTLMYLSNNDKNHPMGTVIALNLNSGKEKEVVEAINNFAISPNKQRIAYISGQTDDGKSIIKVDAIDSELNIGANLVEVNAGYGVLLAWSPDSGHLLYSDSGSLWAVNPETGDKVQLASDMQFILNLLWVNEKEIVFSGVPTGSDSYKNITYRITLQ
ncbi:PD40 domain-containing protein [Desulfofalx alkaliphila]|uniref:PD40 domain-containing protein n=1 Tax=Desulfofalx alkaliphila TaxID=105483 RepID=UPI0004E0E805|nr:PD40 domain-containing protein [Desulfofalx alkaliphila]